MTVCGENGRDGRLCEYDWILKLHKQCKEAGKTFWFKSTGTRFLENTEVAQINPFKQGALAKSFQLDITDGKRLF